MKLRILLALALSPFAVPANGLTRQHAHACGAVYTATNSATSPNEIVAFDRFEDGDLQLAETCATGGFGSGSGLGNQGGVVLSDDGRWLLAVNAGSDEISLFSTVGRGLVLTAVAPSGGSCPISVAVHGDLVYVVNAGGAEGGVDGIAALRIGPHGALTPLPGSSRLLSAADTAPAQIGFSPRGDHVLVTEKGTNLVDVFPLDADGYAGLPTLNPAVGQTPFAFAFGPRDVVFVSEVFGGAMGAGAVSSYELTGSGALVVIQGSVPNHQTAPCWLVATKGGRYVFTTNTPDDSLSGYAADSSGNLELLDPDGRTGEPGAGTRPLDMDLSRDGRFLYTLNIGNDTISTFRVHADGSLQQTAQRTGVPDGANGLAAR